MSYSSTVLGLANLAAFWPLNDAASSTTAADLGPNNLPLTYEASGGSASGAQICAGLTSSFAGSSTQWAQETGSPTGTALAPTSGVTVGAWVQLNSVPSAITYLASRASNWRIALTGTPAVQGVVLVTGGALIGNSTPTEPSSGLPLTTGVPYFLVVSWDGTEITLWINGIKDQVIRRAAGTITATTDKLQVMDGASANVLVSGLFVAGRGITPGECMELFQQGTIATPPIEAITFDLDYSSIPTVESASLSTRCASCGGTRAVNEATVTTSAGYHHHLGCYGARQVIKTQPASVTTGTTPLQYSGEIAKSIWQQIMWNLRRTTPFDLVYLDPTTGLVDSYTTSETTLYTPVSAFASYAGLATAAAGLIRYGNVPSTSWLLRFVKAVHNGAITQQTEAGDYATVAYGTPGQFYPVELAQTILLLGNVLDTATLNAWTTSLLLYMNNQYLGDYYPYYTNGNIELQNLLLVWLMGQITGNSSWTTQYGLQYTVATNPGSISSPPHGVNAAGNGLFYTTTPTLTDGSDGAGYLAESGASATITAISATNPAVVTVSASLSGICPTMSASTNTVIISGTNSTCNGNWTPTPISSTTFSIPVNNTSAFSGSGIAEAQGFDPDYAMFQANVATRLWMYNKDPNMLRLMNLLYNQTMPLFNTSALTYNATNGTRHNLTESYTTVVMPTLGWVYGRTGGLVSITSADLIAHFNGVFTNGYGQAENGNLATWRNIEYELLGLLMCSTDWPGLPEA
jgi:Concanavalin A-like lectin/glucanases superfamily